MNARTGAAWLVQVAILVFVIALVSGQFLGQPLLFSYVETGSMEPTIEQGDGFVVVPPALAGEIGEGDVVVFEAEEIHGGGLTTHRIVGETNEGYLTRGDANPFRDQDSGEPPVRDPQIVAVAWQPGGEVLTIPTLGTAVHSLQSGLASLQQWLAGTFGTRMFLGVQGIGYLLFVASVAIYLLWGFLESPKDRERTPKRETGRSSRRIVLALTLVLLAGPTAAMVLPADAEEFGIVSAEFESDAPDVIERGTNESFTYAVRNSGVVPTVVILEPASANLDVEPERLVVSSRSSENATVTISAPPETGYYREYVQQRRYLLLLPPSLIDELYAMHPWAPILAIDVLLGVPFFILSRRLLGVGRTRSRARRGESLLW